MCNLKEMSIPRVELSEWLGTEPEHFWRGTFDWTEINVIIKTGNTGSPCNTLLSLLQTRTLEHFL